MRNCFVSGCDSYCKANNCVQRKMFSAPKPMIDKWKEVLPKNKRDFKENDRICERHFNPDEILEYWENNINGKVYKTKRDKPKLSSTAVPSRNLETAQHSQKNNTASTKIVRKTYSKSVKVKSDSKRTILEENDDNDACIQEEYTAPKKLKNDDTEEIKKNNVTSELETNFIQMNCSPIKDTNKQVDEEKLEAFDMLYDEYQDVTLPNTLWGYHRCNDRKFVVFSAFNFENMSFNKFLLINDQLICKVFTNGKTKTIDIPKESCNVEYISCWLEKIDEEV
ncbi:hypothetical protein PVAND_013625 [Polypedilum vanderplanki]|uniref:THAP-type domain-containing protein n=1 Tax=Polypedilum vanderplanki TaxID=319348 RepID=A0A9J6CRZ3_POLVA|nr:hypothetical protein PVAND_013625 [Polypedilum vanderplanki]